jgi:nucleoside-diphosphate-sugar epimerase
VRILVTGINGFIGSHIAEHLTRQNRDAAAAGLPARHHIVGLDIRRPAFAFDADYEDLRGDTRDRALVRKLVGEADCVIHMAGVLGTSETMDFLEETSSTNVMGSLNVFEAARDEGKRCVYITVGNDWLNPYSITKQASARLAQMINKWQHGKIVVVRGLNAYGPRQKAYPVRKVFPMFALSALSGIPLRVHDKGNMIIDLVHVRDLARGLVLAALAPEQDGLYEHVLDLGTERKTEVLWLARYILEQVNGGPADTDIEHVQMRLGEPKDSVTLGDVRNSSKYISYVPEIPIEEGIPETLAWYAAHRGEFPEFR